MYNSYTNNFRALLLPLFSLLFIVSTLDLQADVPLRRPISPEQPAYFVHIDTWNYADPQKIINLISEDIRPYVVMNISLSISHNVETSQFQVAEYGYEIAKSWLRICAQNQMWAVVQLASGGFAQFSDFDLSVYEEFYNDYPNLIGFNYAEQFWGYDDANDPLSPKWSDRMAHLANMLELGNRYGGYLVVSWCGNQWSPSINPIGMLKRTPAFVEASEMYSDNYILFEKYTQQSYQSDMESLCLGAYLSGYSGNYGIRYDSSGWTDVDGENTNFTMASGGAPHLEHIMLTGQTVIDGPELIWTQCFRETERKKTTNGYFMRNWETFPQFNNVTVDIFKKILDGTIRIPSRQEIIDRTKFVIINDDNMGNSDNIYSSPETLFEGLYRMDGDGNLRNNKTFFKKTGRYPTVPTVFKLYDDVANSFDYKIKRSDFSSRWPTITDKVNEFNTVFPEEYSGNLYAGRHENGWVIYNPFKTGQNASANIPFKYNTSDSMKLTFSQYTASVMKEYSDSVTLYLSNYDNVLYSGRKSNIIKIYGSILEPEFSVKDRGNHQGSIVSSDWSDGVFTLTLEHNGPLDVSIKCAGTVTDRLTSYSSAKIIEPQQPPVYTGPRQYEAECFDYKNISGITTAGQYGSIRNYTGQGYLSVGTQSGAAVRGTVNALRKGTYTLITRYSLNGGDVNTLDLYVNGIKVANPLFKNTRSLSSWDYNVQTIELKTGDNLIEYKANRVAPYSVVLDNIVITQGKDNGLYHFENDESSSEAVSPPAHLINTISGSAGVVEFSSGNTLPNNMFKAYSTGALNSTGVADLEMFNSLARNYSVVWKEYNNSFGERKGVLLRASGEHGSSPYAEGLKQGYLFVSENNADNTATLKCYKADKTGIVEMSEFTSNFTLEPGQACWYRAKANQNQLSFEVSIDSLNWFGSKFTTFTDDSYSIGATQLVWGLNSEELGWVIDNITYLAENIIVSKLSLDNFRYGQGRGPSDTETFSLSGSSLSDDIKLYIDRGFEISLEESEGFGDSLNLYQVDGNVAATTVYVRMKEGLPVEMVNGEISILIGENLVRSVELKGIVTPQEISYKYDFSDDRATLSASNPPAKNISIAKNNSATAGVVSYLDALKNKSNMFKPYSLGQRNSTGVVNLDLFPDNATDYSITWKQHIGSPGSDYKIGVLLRGDPENVGTSTTGYVQGMMHGYLFIVYHTANSSQFRIYRSSSTYNSLNTLINNGVASLTPASGQPVWYRASATGFSSVILEFEYSLDGVNWLLAAKVTDNAPPVYRSGATQIVWGLAATTLNFYIDDVIFDGLHMESGTLPENIVVSEKRLDGFNYPMGKGPSNSQSFLLSGDKLTGNILIDAPIGYELSLNSESGYAQSLSLAENGGLVNESTIYVRLKADLASADYQGEIKISSIDNLSRFVQLTGSVYNSTVVGETLDNTATVLYTEYYSLNGQKLLDIKNFTGVYVERVYLSDGTISSKKMVKLR